MLELIRLRNFKAFDDQTLELRPLTLLTGLNSTGKSSVIQALLLLAQNDFEDPLSDTEQVSEPLILNGKYVQLGNANDVLYEWANEDYIEVELRSKFFILSSVSSKYIWRFNRNKEEDALEVDRMNSSTQHYGQSVEAKAMPKLAAPFRHRFVYLAAERLGPRKLSDINMTDEIGIYGEYAIYQLYKWRNNEIQYALVHNNAISNTLFNNVEAWLGEISPGVRIQLNPLSNIDSIQALFAFEMNRDVSNYYRATNVGFGITYTLPVILAILSAKPGTLLILENPEAHLHPKGQARLGELIAFAAAAGIQILVETHSDHILNGIRVATKDQKIKPDDIAIHYFAREEGHRTYYHIPIDADGNLGSWPDGFFDEYENMLTKLL